MKKRKFQSGGISDDVRARALKYASMAGSGTEETEAQKDFIRKQAGREDYGRPKAAANPAPKKPAATKLSPNMDETLKRFKEQTKREKEDQEDSQKLNEDLERKAIPAGSTRGMSSRREADIPYETIRPVQQRKSFGSRILDALTQGGAGDIRNILGSAVPTAVRGSKSIADMFKTIREGKRRAAMEKAGKAPAKRNADVERMEGEAPAPITPRMPRRQESPGPRDMDELRMSGEGMGFKKGGKTKKYAQGGSVSSRADGIAKRGKTNCKIC